MIEYLSFHGWVIFHLIFLTDYSIYCLDFFQFYFHYSSQLISFFPFLFSVPSLSLFPCIFLCTDLEILVSCVSLYFSDKNQPPVKPSSQATGLPRWLSSKESTWNAGVTGDTGSIPGWGRVPGGGQGNPLQCSCLEDLMQRSLVGATAHSVTKSWLLLKRLSMHSAHCPLIRFPASRR